MKNLFIFWDEPLNSTGGGIHRIIKRLIDYLPEHGFNVRYLYTKDTYHTFHLIDDRGDERVFFIDELREYLIEQECDIILGQEAVFSDDCTRLVRELAIPGVKFINQYHSTLLYFDKKLNWDYLRYVWNTSKDFKSRLGVGVRAVLYPFWRWKTVSTQHRIYRYNYANSNLSLFLSEYEIPIMAQITGATSMAKCIAIPNPLSWEEIAAPSILDGKQKEVLIVSRIYNIEKRIDLSLQVWKKLQDAGATDGWVLRIVGDGVDKEYLMKMSSEMKLQNVVWEKRQDPLPFYHQASIFLLTSKVEGWALTLTESMQNGVVPIAFDSYPAVRSIITDGYDGCLIPAMDVDKMVDRLGELMRNKDKREQIAINGLNSCRRFTIDKVMEQWKNMLNNL